MLAKVYFFLSVVNLILICKVYLTFKEITDNQEKILYELHDDIQRLRDDGK